MKEFGKVVSQILKRYMYLTFKWYEPYAGCEPRTLLKGPFSSKSILKRDSYYYSGILVPNFFCTHNILCHGHTAQ